MHDQLANPFRKKDEDGDAPRRKPPGKDGGTPRELARLYVMALVFLMSVAGMIYMWRVAATPPPKKSKSGVGLLRPDGTRQDAEVEAPAEALPPVRKDVALQELPKDGVIDFKALAEPFRDGQEKPVKETPEFVAMLRVMLTSVTPEMLAKRANPELTADLAYHETQKNRGEVVRARGRLVKIYTEPLDTTIPEKVEYVHLGILMEYPSNRTVWVYLPEKPVDARGEPLKFKTYVKGGEEFYEDWVELEGVVLRRYDYPSQFEDARQQEPVWARSLVLFGKTLRIVEKPRMTNTKAGFVAVVVVVAVLLVVIVITAGVMTRRYGGDRSLRMAVAAARRDKAKQAGQPAFPAPDPGKQVLGAEVPPSGKDEAPPGA